MATHQIAQGLAGLGRYGDSTLVHMQPEEVAGLQALAKSQGTSLTINPETGLPEAFNLGGFFNSLLPVLAGAATGGAGAPLWAGIAAGAATGAVTNRKDPLMGAVMGGMGGYGGFNLGQGFASAGAGSTAPAAGGVQIGGSAAAPTGTGVQIGQDQLNQALAKSGVNFDPLAQQSAQNIMANTGPGVAFKNTFAQTTMPGDIGYLGQGISGKEIMNTGAIGSASPGGSYSASQGLQNMGQGFQNVATGQEGAWDAFKQGLAGAGKAPVSNLSAAGSLGMPLGGAVLGGLEPSDFYGDPMKPSDKDKYDPYKTLNLNTNTGLKLYAQGGPVSFADGGDALKGGGSGALRGGDLGAMEGSGLASLDVSDIDARYNLSNPSAAQPWGGSGTWGSYNTWGANSGTPSIEPPKLGLFASNDQIEAARTAYEAQLAAAMSGRGGMGSFPGANALFGTRYRDSGGPMAGSMGAISGGPAAAIARNGMGSTAPTASTALSRLNLNKQYAAGGTIQSGGLQDLYGSSDNVTGPALSRDGYGLGRLQAMANGGVAGFAEGGAMQGGGSGAMQGGNLNLNSASGLRPIVTNTPNRNYSNRFNSMEEGMRLIAPAGFNSMEEGMRLNTPAGLNSMELGMLSLGYAKGGYLDGPGDGMSDSIPATIEGKQPARLADGEFVVPADVVSHLGNGSTKAGSQRLYGMLDKVRKARTGTKKQGKQIKAEKYLPA